MRTRAIITMLALSACTTYQQGTELKSELYLPLTYPQWESENMTTSEGDPVCAVFSGHNGITVLLRKKLDGGLGVSVKNNRILSPGGDFSINVNGNHYRTSNEFFLADESVQIAQDLSEGDKAYLEWSEARPHHGFLRSTMILKLEGFSSIFEQCKRILLVNTGQKH